MYSGGSASHGGLVGEGAGSVRDSYWDIETSGQTTSAVGTSKTTVALQSPTSATGIYIQWSEDNWDFGNSMQYPTLKYSQNPDGSGLRTCGSDDLPSCGSLIAPQLRSGFIRDLILINGELSPPFDVGYGSYSGTVLSLSDTIRLRPITVDAAAEIKIYAIDGSGRTQLGNTLSSGDISARIPLQRDTINYVVLAIKPTDGPTVEYPLYLQYRFGMRIDSLEDLNAVRNHPDADYILTRDLDFEDDASYDSVAFKAAWTVSNYRDAADLGWQPIGNVVNNDCGMPQVAASLVLLTATVIRYPICKSTTATCGRTKAYSGLWVRPE